MLRSEAPNDNLRSWWLNSVARLELEPVGRDIYPFIVLLLLYDCSLSILSGISFSFGNLSCFKLTSLVRCISARLSIFYGCASCEKILIFGIALVSASFIDSWLEFRFIVLCTPSSDKFSSVNNCLRLVSLI